MNALYFAAITTVITFAGCSSGGTLLPRMAGPVQTVYEGPTFWDLEATHDAVGVDRDGRIAAFYAHGDAALAELPPTVARIRLPGRFALPGLRDGHVHLPWIGRASETVNLRGAKSPAEVATRVIAFAETHPAVMIIKGSGWDQTLFPDQLFPTSADLPGSDTAVGGRQVVLSRVDGHAVWVNQAALGPVEAALANASAAPSQRILQGVDGPTGVVVDPSESLMAAFKTDATSKDIERWLLRGLEACAAAGLVEVHDMATSVAELDALIRLSKRHGALPLRVVVYLDTSEASWSWLERHAEAKGPSYRVVQPTPWIRVAGVKAFADGALGSRGAALKADYHDEPGHQGQPTDVSKLNRFAARAHALGKQVAIHAIGDLGNANALDAIEAAQGSDLQRRHRVEHAQVIGEAELKRILRLSVVASMQPTHATSDMRWAEQRLGAKRIAGAYAWRTVLNAGIPLAFGSDAPVESHRPLLGIYAAVTRQDLAGEPRGGWRVSERLTAAEAVAAFTAGVAFASYDEGHGGTMAVGQRFEVTVLDRDPRSDASAWRDANVTARHTAPW